MRLLPAILLAAALCLPAADTLYPRQGWAERPDPAAAPDEALAGGTYCESLGPSPKSLNYYLDNNVMSAQVFGLLYETLITRDPKTLEWAPGLASRWSVSEDRRTFTFWLDPNARWSDGRPVTAADVVWTYQALMDPKNLTGSIKFALEQLEPPVILPDGAVQFHAKSLHWRNLQAAGDFSILPKHAFAGKDFNLVNFEFPVVSGPYRIRDFQPGQLLLLEKRPDWWRAKYPAAKGVYNFQFLKLRFFEDQNNAFDAFLKGQLDQITIYTASQWHRIESRVSAVRNNWIVKQEVHNHSPVGMQGFAINLRRPLFQDVRVRRALAHLLNRAFMNHTMMFDQYFLHRSFWEDLYDDAHPNPNPEIAFDPQKARALLAEAGWKPNPKTGTLEKNGRPFEFTFLNRGGTDKFLAVYNEALKDVGIRMTIVTKDWSAWAKDIDEFNFDLTWAAWSGGLFKDPEQMWSSREAARQGSSNITGFADPRVDALIDAQKGEFDVAKRNAILRQIDAILYDQCPYILLWNIGHSRILYWNKFGTPQNVMGKYGDAASSLWWNDPDRAAELQDAMKSNTPLPAEPPRVDWKER